PRGEDPTPVAAPSQNCACPSFANAQRSTIELPVLAPPELANLPSRILGAPEMPMLECTLEAFRASNGAAVSAVLRIAAATVATRRHVRTARAHRYWQGTPSRRQETATRGGKATSLTPSREPQ